MTRSFSQETIKPGFEIPHDGVHLHSFRSASEGIFHTEVSDVLRDDRVLILGVPFAMETSYLADLKYWAKELKQVRRQLGLDHVFVVIAGNPYEANAMHESESLNGEPIDSIMSFWSDSDMQIAKRLGMVYDARPDGLGITSLRYAVLVDHFDVKYVASEPHHSIDAVAFRNLFDAIQDLITSGAIPPQLPRGHDEL